jgi:hypothetical protein
MPTLRVRGRNSSKTAFLGIVALVLLAALGSPSAAHSAPAGLVAAYSFNEGAGGTVADASGNGNTGTINGAA